MLHLAGMRDCENRWSPSCVEDPTPGWRTWWDWCTDTPVIFDQEVVLVITLALGLNHPPRDLNLNYLEEDPDTSAGFFELASQP